MNDKNIVFEMIIFRFKCDIKRDRLKILDLLTGHVCIHNLLILYWGHWIKHVQISLSIHQKNSMLV